MILVKVIKILKKTQPQGFTLIDLLASTVILMIMLSFVIANFRTAQNSGNLDIVLRRVIESIGKVRNLSLGGQITNETFPTGGYGIHFDFANPSQYALFAAFEKDDGYIPSGAQANGLPSSVFSFSGVKFIQFCGHQKLAQDEILGLPCEGQGWQQISWQNAEDFLEINFLALSEMAVNYTNKQPDENYRYIGGVFIQEKTDLQGYFYVSLTSGLVTGDLIR
ncbi:MAG: hypothetical protein WCW26_05170 [Candidatus Buchananbacteria bacterium]